MSSDRNQFGLSRHIPADVKAEVRRRSKQGCVICRALGYDYEHINPEFADAKSHDAERICLLCPSHHAEVTRGRLSKQQVRGAYEGVQRSSKVRPPMYRAQLTGSLKLGLGDALFDYMPAEAAVLRYDGNDVLKVGYVTDEIFGGSRPSISGIVCDENGSELLRIVDNELNIIDDRVDVKFHGTRLRVYAQRRKPVLEITFSPPDGIRIDRLRFGFGEIVCEMDQTFGITMPTIDGRRARFTLSGISASGAHAALDYSSDQTKWHSGDDPLRLMGLSQHRYQSRHRRDSLPTVQVECQNVARGIVQHTSFRTLFWDGISEPFECLAWAAKGMRKILVFGTEGSVEIEPPICPLLRSRILGDPQSL